MAAAVLYMYTAPSRGKHDCHKDFGLAGALGFRRSRSEGRFPAAVHLGDTRMAFLKSEVLEWIAARGANDRAWKREAA